MRKNEVLDEGKSFKFRIGIFSIYIYMFPHLNLHHQWFIPTNRFDYSGYSKCTLPIARPMRIPLTYQP